MADEAVEEAPTKEPTQENNKRRPLSMLAQDTFGDNFHGTPAVEEPEEPKQDQEPVSEEEPEQDSPTDPEEGTQKEEGAESEGEEQEADQAGNEEGEEETISSLSELIEHQQWDPEWVDTLQVPVKVDGQEAKASLKDLVDNYQMNAAADKRLEEAKAKREALTKELTEKSEALQGKFATAAKIIENAEKVLDKDSSSIDWQRLRADDPAEYSAKKAEMAERREEINKMKTEAATEWQRHLDEQNQQSEEQYREHLVKEQQALLEKLPEWQDQEVAKAEKAKLVSYLQTQGFTEQDVMGASDHRLILLARKAMLHDEGKTKTQVAKKRVAKVPKVLKPGASKSAGDQNKERVSKLKDKVRSTGSLDDAYALLKARKERR